MFLSLILTITIHGRLSAGVDQTSLLYTLISGEEVSEGPLDPSAYAQTDAPGIGGSRLAAVDGASGLDIITFGNPEVNFSATLGGNVAQAPLSPTLDNPQEEGDGESTSESAVTREAFVYTVQEGDTIAGIAEKHDITTDTILWSNGLSGTDIIKVGDHLTILPTSGVLHTVSSGDTLLAIAKKYDVEALEIAKYNQLEDTHALSIGEKLIIPGGEIITPRAVPQVVSRDTRLAEETGPTPEPVKAGGAGMVWPTTTKHISQYFRWGHTGVDIDNRSQPAIYAALDGTVEFAGWLGAYGNLVIINHGNGMQTYYAHNSKFYVGKGQAVTKGQAIAQMGSTGRSTGPHLHFEVRRNGAPINPMGMY